MPVILHEYAIPPVTGVPRSPTVTLQLPTGTAVLGIITIPGDAAPRLIVRGDTAQPAITRTFIAVRQDVALTAAEAAGAYVGSFAGYRTERTPQGPALFGVQEVYHVLEL